VFPIKSLKQAAASALRARRAGLCLALALAVVPAQAREGAPASVLAQKPVELGGTQSGNYLAALIAGSQRDTRAAAAQRQFATARGQHAQQGVGLCAQGP